MGKKEFITPKAMANRIKAKGLQKLQWYCQMCQKQCRDENDFKNSLLELYRGLFILPRPDKSVVESQVMQKQEFVEQRRVALEKYLRRLAAHPMIRRSDELKVFLQVQGKLPLPTTTDMASRMLDGAVKLPKHGQ